ACARCHQVSSFHEVRFDHDKDSRFPLTGKHAKAACAQCHVPDHIGGVTTIRYRPLEQSCAACHADAHAGQFRKKDAPGEVEGCADCHDTRGFKPAPTFVHGPPFTAYQLDGKHQQVKCEACHQEVAVGSGPPVRKYVGLPTTCAGC